MQTHEARITWKTDYSAEIEILGVRIPVDAVASMRLAERTMDYAYNLALAEGVLGWEDYPECFRLLDEIEAKYGSNSTIEGLRWELQDAMTHGLLDGN